MAAGPAGHAALFRVRRTKAYPGVAGNDCREVMMNLRRRLAKLEARAPAASAVRAVCLLPDGTGLALEDGGCREVPDGAALLREIHAQGRFVKVYLFDPRQLDTPTD
jgi:hypothetical protein